MLPKSQSTFATASVIAVALASIVSTNPAGATAVDTQVTDAVTQANVKVVGSSPAMSMGTLYQSTAHSTGLQLNNSPGLVTHAQSFTTQGVQQIYSVDTAPDAQPTARVMELSQDSQAKVFRKVDAMAQRLAECGEACVLNVHVHTAPGPVRDAKGDSCEAGDFQVSGADIPSSGTVTPAQLITTCLVARMEATSGVDVEGVAWVIQDAPTEISSPIFEVDLYVQRLP